MINSTGAIEIGIARFDCRRFFYMRHFILDIDGTIWNTTGVVATAWNRAVKESNISELKDLNITDKTLQKEFGKPMNVIADDLFGDIDPDKKAKLLEVCCKYEHQAIAENETNLTYEGVRETIEKLSKTDSLYIVSNCQDGYIELVIAKNGIEKYIKDFECFGHTGLSKADNIKLVMERNNINPEDAFYVGDTMGDYEASKEAGVKFIHAAYGFGNVPDAYKVVNSFSEIM